MRKVMSLLVILSILGTFITRVSAYEVGSENPCDSDIAICSATQLQYSEVAEPWADKYYNFNCYGYALGLEQRKLPGDFAGPTASKTDILGKIAEAVVRDLEHLGYTNIRKLGVGEYYKGLCGTLFIALRAKEGVDYHFMRFDYSDRKWYHKPDQSTILEYIGDPLLSTAVWTNEMYINNQYQATSIEYDSTIIGIAAGLEHRYEQYIYWGNDRHILSCLGCTSTTGSTMPCIYRGNVCSVCGHTDSTGGGGFDIMAAESP